jgi:ferredoxin-NADP reductase
VTAATTSARGARDAAKHAGIRVHVAYSRPLPGDTGYDSVGRVDGALLARLVPELEAHYYLCGPVGFMAAIQSDLERRGVGAGHIHTESFGPLS